MADSGVVVWGVCRSGGAGFLDLKVKQRDWLNTNRVEVLRLLLVCLSETLYAKPDPLNPVRQPA